MRKHTPAFLVAIACLAIASLLVTWSVIAQDDGSESEDASEASGGSDEAAMMEAFMAAGIPGEAHERLAESVGTWNMEIKMWMGPGEPSVTTGTAERSMILDGRVLVEEVDSSMMGQPFQGYGMTGYDNVTGKYWGTWNDNVSTGISTSHGTYDAESNTYTYLGEAPNPMTGGTTKTRGTIKVSEGKEVMEYFETHDGHEVKTMEIVYTRK